MNGTVVLQELGYVAVDGGLEERNSESGSLAGVLGDQSMGRVGRSQGSRQKLGAEHGQMVGEGQGLGFGVEVLDIGLEDPGRPLWSWGTSCPM